MKDPKMTAYCLAVQQLNEKFDGIELHHMQRTDIVTADTLARMGMTREIVPSNIFLEHLHQPSGQIPTNPEEDLVSTEPGPAEVGEQMDAEVPADEALTVIPAWSQPIVAYLINRELPKDRNEARQIVCRSKAYTVIQGELYK